MAQAPFPDPTIARLGPCAFLGGGSALWQAIRGPKSGTLKHDGDAYVESFDAGVSVRDFIAQVRFFNPYARDVNTWDYGLFFRYVEDGGHFRLVIRSSRRWLFLYNPGSGTSDEIREGVLTNLNIDGGYNDIKLACLGDKCEFYLNGSLIATLDVSRHTDAGDISVGTGFYTDNEVTGEETRFEDFTIWNNP